MCIHIIFMSLSMFENLELTFPLLNRIHVAIVVYISNTILALSALLYKHHFSWLTLCKTCKRCLWENRQICELNPPDKWIMFPSINMANVSFRWLIC